MKWAGHVSLKGETQREREREEGNVYILVGRPEGKKLLGKPRRRWEDNIRMNVMEIGWKGVDWIHMAHYRD
jgi:hypothetical protein